MHMYRSGFNLHLDGSRSLGLLRHGGGLYLDLNGNLYLHRLYRGWLDKLYLRLGLDKLHLGLRLDILYLRLRLNKLRLNVLGLLHLRRGIVVMYLRLLLLLLGEGQHHHVTAAGFCGHIAEPGKPV